MDSFPEGPLHRPVQLGHLEVAGLGRPVDKVLDLVEGVPLADVEGLGGNSTEIFLA